MVIDDNKVKKLLVEPDGAGLTCSLSENVLNAIKKGDLAK
jgi:peroxiredoxin